MTEEKPTKIENQPCPMCQNNTLDLEKEFSINISELKKMNYNCLNSFFWS